MGPWDCTSPPGRAVAWESLEQRLLLSNGPVLSEFLADNNTGLTDEDGDHSDWIEIHNPGASDISLDGWFLTDDPGELTQWALPDVTVAAGEYLVVFASGKDRSAGAGELHTNFKLASGGEYLALVEPDGATVADAFDPFPAQYTDVSYGAAEEATTVLAGGAPVRYLVPTASDAALGTTWTEMGYDDSAWIDAESVLPPTVVITEIGTGVPDWIEIQNVSGSAADTAGWYLAVNDQHNDSINDVHATVCALPNSLAAGEVLYRDDAAASGDEYFGEGIWWQTAGEGWVMLLDDVGEVVDFVVWGYSAGDLATLDVTIEGHRYRAADMPWRGEGAGAGGTSSNSLQRTGSIDHDTAADFAFVSPSSARSANTGLVTPLAADAAPAVTGLGFSSAGDGFAVTLFDANVTVDSLAVAETVIADPGNRTAATQATAATINYLSTGSSAHFGADEPFPGKTIGTDDNDIVLLATASVLVPHAGAWTFGVNSDDGFGLTLSRGNDTFEMSHPGVRGAGDTLATFDLPEAGTYDLRLVYYERGGGCEVELFAADGSYAAFDAGAFALVGDTDVGELSVRAFAGALATDVGPAMQNVNASLYARQEFEIDGDVADLAGMGLRVKYDDGFVAYLNGQEIARRNAPAAPVWNSTATAARDGAEPASFEDINVSAYLGLLQTGTNVLAVHALNASAVDGDLLILPELVVTSGQETYRYFATPTPGGPNAGSFQDYVADVTFSADHGFYTEAFDLELTTATPGATIRYTLDGTDPTETSGTVYAGPVTISGTSVVRAGAFLTGFEPSDVDTRTYVFLADVLTQSPDGSPMPGWPSPGGSGKIAGQVIDYGMDPDIVNDATWGPQLIDALTDIPSLSIVTDLDNLYDPTTGIYVNAIEHGDEWERPASLELIDPGGSEGFQIDMGLRIRGGYSRNDNNPKHAFRFFFRGEYGETKLRYPIFDDEGADEFDSLDLRTAQNYSWSFHGDVKNAMVRDVWSRDLQGEMGQPYTRSRYYHLYINGAYWGLYQTQERAEADYAETYLGGDAEDYDVIKSTGSSASYTIEATDGTMDAWTDLWNQAKAGFGTDEAYYKVQGLNPDGTRNENYDVLVDVDNLIDYMIVILYTGNKDAPISNFLGNNSPNNWFGIRDRTGEQGFVFFAHDCEHTLLVGDLNINRNGPWPAGDTLNKSNPQWIHQELMAHPDYCMRFADRAGELFADGGLMSVEANIARLQKRADEIDLAIIAESARWGDAKVATPRTKTHWDAAIADMVNNYFPQRGEIVLTQFHATTLRDGSSAPLLPSIDAPAFNQQGGTVDAGFGLTMSAAGTIYYTLDGSDPRLPGGAVAADAQVFFGSATWTTLLAAGSDWKYLDDGSDQGSAWHETAFDDSGWATGSAQLGYGGNGEVTTISYGPNAANKHVTYYFRQTVQVDDVDRITAATAHLVRDDGAIVYVNGVEAGRSNMPAGAVGYQTFAAQVVGGTAETAVYDLTIDPALLVEGTNVIAVEVHQVVVTSSDLSFDLSLVAEYDASDPVTLSESTLVRARARDDDEWSALNQAQFYVHAPADADNVAVAEIHYHPYAPSDDELAAMAPLTAEDFEFVELVNASDAPVDLTGVAFTDGIAFTFATGPQAMLEPGQRVVIAGNVEAFELRYGTDLPIAGQFEGKLRNEGEDLTVVDRFGAVIADFEYESEDGWPGRADGKGASLELIDLGGGYEEANWRSSGEIGGTPGTAGQGPRTDVVINEVLTHTDPPQSDSIELHNTSDAAVGVGGWFLSDNEDDYAKFQIPAGTIIPAGGYVVFDESDFNPTLGAGPSDFALDGAHGDEVWLVEGVVGAGPTRFVDHVVFQAAANGESFGLWPDGDGDLVPMTEVTLGSANAAPRIGPLLISEVNYNSGEPDGSDDFEFIEVLNPTDAAVVLTDWRIRGGVDYDFDAGFLLPAGAALVVLSFDPDDADNAARTQAFRDKYALDLAVVLVGGYSGKLDNGGEKVRLERPDEPPTEEPEFTPHLIEDEIRYADEPPWPDLADGGGQSLHRLGSQTWGYDQASWAGASPTPGQAAPTPVAGDDAYETDEDVLLQVLPHGVLANDDGPPGTTAELVTAPAHGTLTLHADGSFTYTPAHDYGGTDSFTYQAVAQQMPSAAATVTITVHPVNDAPQAAPDDYQTAEDTPLVAAAPGVLAGDTDAENDTLHAALVAGCAHGELALADDGSFTYTPQANYHGPDAFTYRADDGQAASAPVTVSLTVSPANDPPVASDNTYSLLADEVFDVPAPGVLADDADIDGDAIQAAMEDPPAHGQLTLTEDGAFEYTPDPGFVGEDSFTYRADDGTEVSAPATVTLHVGSANAAPQARADDYQTAEDAPLTVPAPGVLANDTDADGQALSASLAEPPQHGQVSLQADGSLVYTPDANFHGADTLTYQAGDGLDESPPAQVHIVVTPVNDAPVARAGGDEFVVDIDDDGLAEVSLDASASTDVESALTFTWWRDGQLLADSERADVDLPPGHHVLLLCVTDDQGATAVDTHEVDVVRPAGTTPVALTHPDVDQAIDPSSGPVEIAWSGVGQGAILDLWGLGAGGWLCLAEDVSGDLGQYNWDASGALLGWWGLCSRIQRGQGVTVSVSPAVVRLLPSGAAPAGEGAAPAGLSAPVAAPVVFLDPLADRTVSAGEPVSIAWTVTQPDAVAETLSLTALSADGGLSVPIASAAEASAGQAVWDTAGAPAGRYRIEIRWLDEALAVQTVVSSAWVEVL